MNVGEVIKDKRQKRKLTQMELAELLKVTPQAVSKWETGKTQPDIETLHNISMILGVSIEELIYGTEQKSVVIKERTGNAAKGGCPLAQR